MRRRRASGGCFEYFLLKIIIIQNRTKSEQYIPKRRKESLPIL